MQTMTENTCSSRRDDESSWRAVIGRDRQADGSFVYAVRSTGIYCRPSCPSRRPRRNVVEFFATASAAEQAGFGPAAAADPRDLAQPDPWLQKIRRACVVPGERRGPPVAGDARGTIRRQPVSSAAQLQADRGRHTARIRGGVPLAESQTPAPQRPRRDGGDGRCRLRLEQPFLRTGCAEARHAAQALSTRRSRHRRSATRSWTRRLDVLLVAATSRGVCAVAMGASDDDLERRLAEEFPAAAVTRDPGGLARWTAQVLAHLEGRRPRLDLPLDVQATAFQWQVWNALAAIPYGETRSYTEVASAIGRPRAARAVARACASNPVALAIPCHRVVPSSGGPAGYRWGVGRKKALLSRERDCR